MIDPLYVPPVADNELLARFIVYDDEKRADGTVRHKLFMPYRLTELSVNRHREATAAKTGRSDLALPARETGSFTDWPIFGPQVAGSTDSTLWPTLSCPRIRTTPIYVASQLPKKIRWQLPRCSQHRLWGSGSRHPREDLILEAG